MNNEHTLRDLIQKKRTYESMLALNSAGKHKSTAIKQMLDSQLRIVQQEIQRLRHQR